MLFYSTSEQCEKPTSPSSIRAVLVAEASTSDLAALAQQHPGQFADLAAAVVANTARIVPFHT